MADIRNTTTLWRPVGPEEAHLVHLSGWREFPPRLPEQPIFYPVLSLRYASEIAERWNVRDSGAGFVTRFRVRDEVVARYERHVVGAPHHAELWVPAEELDAFNAAIVGEIEIVRRFELGHDWETSHRFTGEMSAWPDRVRCLRCGATGASFLERVYREDDFTAAVFAIKDIPAEEPGREDKARDIISGVRPFGPCEAESIRAAEQKPPAATVE